MTCDREAEHIIRAKLAQTRNILERQKLLKALWKLEQEAEQQKQSKEPQLVG